MLDAKAVLMTYIRGVMQREQRLLRGKKCPA